MSTTSVLRHTSNELLEALGQAPQPEGLHIFIQHGAAPEIPVLHPHRMDFPLFFLVLEGELTLKINLSELRVKKNEFVFISPNTIRQFISTSEDIQISCMCFTIDFVLKTGIAKSSLDPSAYLSTKQSPHIALATEETALLQELMQMSYLRNMEEEASPYRLERLTHCFSLLLYEIATLFTKSRKNIPLKLTRKEELSATFLNLLNLHFKEQRSLQFYADLLYITPKYLTQTIKETLGKTAGELIDEMVVTEAKVLLHTTSQTIAQVAEVLYFSDQFFFSKFFKNQTGITPSDYRKATSPH